MMDVSPVPVDGPFKRAIRSMSIHEFDFFLGLVGFFVVRHLVPQRVLGKKANAVTGIVLAFCYALFGYIRTVSLEFKRTV